LKLGSAWESSRNLCNQPRLPAGVRPTAPIPTWQLSSLAFRFLSRWHDLATTVTSADACYYRAGTGETPKGRSLRIESDPANAAFTLTCICAPIQPEAVRADAVSTLNREAMVAASDADQTGRATAPSQTARDGGRVATASLPVWHWQSTGAACKPEQPAAADSQQRRGTRKRQGAARADGPPSSPPV